MTTTTPLITDNDRQRLGTMIERATRFGVASRDDLHALEHELELACCVEAACVPGDVVTMNSTVELCDVDTGDEETYTLVYPDRSSVVDGKLSVLAPLGTTILGARVGDVLEVPTPAGPRRVRVVSIHFQPESAGRFDL